MMPGMGDEALLDALEDLIRARGAAPFLSTPMLEPSPEFFPDRFTPDVRGAVALARRLLAYAGLSRLEPQVHLDETSGAHGDRAAWFNGIGLGKCVIGVRADLLHDPDGLVAALCHEVAHAYRAAHGMQESDREIEEPLTDATTVFLGFGILTTAASY